MIRRRALSEESRDGDGSRNNYGVSTRKMIFLKDLPTAQTVSNESSGIVETKSTKRRKVLKEVHEASEELVPDEDCTEKPSRKRKLKTVSKTNVTTTENSKEVVGKLQKDTNEVKDNENVPCTSKPGKRMTKKASVQADPANSPVPTVLDEQQFPIDVNPEEETVGKTKKKAKKGLNQSPLDNQLIDSITQPGKRMKKKASKESGSSATANNRSPTVFDEQQFPIDENPEEIKAEKTKKKMESKKGLNQSPLDNRLIVNIDLTSDDEVSKSVAVNDLNLNSGKPVRKVMKNIDDLQNSMSLEVLKVTAKTRPVSSMSAYELVSNIGTLRGGMGLFRQRVCNKIGSKEFEHRLRRTNSSETDVGNVNQDCDDGSPRTRSKSKRALMSKNTSEDTVCKYLRDRHIRMSQDQASPEEQKKGDGNHHEEVEGLTSTDQRYGTDFEESDDFQNEGDNEFGGEVADQDEALFGELFNRFIKPVGQSYEEQFDLSTKGQLMRSVFQDYDEKVKFYDRHVRNIQDLTSAELDKVYLKVRREVLDIFEGRLETNRMKLYMSDIKDDRQRLKCLNVADPFNSLQGMTIVSNLFEYLIPEPESRLKFNDYINFVILPEALIRIFARVNDISLEMAEKEMKCGPRYDGPLPAEWYPNDGNGEGDLVGGIERSLHI